MRGKKSGWVVIKISVLSVSSIVHFFFFFFKAGRRHEWRVILRAQSVWLIYPWMELGEERERWWGWGGVGVGGVGAVTQVKVLGLCHCRFTVMHLCVDTHQGRGYLAVRSNLA